MEGTVGSDAFRHWRENLYTIVKCRRLSGPEVQYVINTHPQHGLPITCTPPAHPVSGTLLLCPKESLAEVKKDGVKWVKRANTNRVREDHIRLRVGGSQCLAVYYCTAVDSSLYRRRYSLGGDNAKSLNLIHYFDASQADQALAAAQNAVTSLGSDNGAAWSKLINDPIWYIPQPGLKEALDNHLRSSAKDGLPAELPQLPHGYGVFQHPSLEPTGSSITPLPPAEVEPLGQAGTGVTAPAADSPMLPEEFDFDELQFDTDILEAAIANGGSIFDLIPSDSDQAPVRAAEASTDLSDAIAAPSPLPSSAKQEAQKAQEAQEAQAICIIDFAPHWDFRDGGSKLLLVLSSPAVPLGCQGVEIAFGGCRVTGSVVASNVLSCTVPPLGGLSTGADQGYCTTPTTAVSVSVIIPTASGPLTVPSPTPFQYSPSKPKHEWELPQAPQPVAAPTPTNGTKGGKRGRAEMGKSGHSLALDIASGGASSTGKAAGTVQPYPQTEIPMEVVCDEEPLESLSSSQLPSPWELDVRESKIRIVEKFREITTQAGNSQTGKSTRGPQSPVTSELEPQDEPGSVRLGEDELLNDLELDTMDVGELEVVIEQLTTRVISSLAQLQQVEELRELDDSGFNLLHYSCLYGLKPMVPLLLKRGLNPSQPTACGQLQAPLHLATIAGDLEVVKTLVEAGASLDDIDASGATPLERARIAGHHSIVTYLEQVDRGAARRPSPIDKPSSETSNARHFDFGEIGPASPEMGPQSPSAGPSTPKMLKGAFASLSLREKCVLSLSMTEREVRAPSSMSTVLSNEKDSLEAAMNMMGRGERKVLEDEAKVIQQNVRAWLLRRNYKNLRSAVSALQTMWREKGREKRHQSAEFSSDGTMTSAAVLLQANTRGMLARKKPSAPDTCHVEQIKRETCAMLVIEQGLRERVKQWVEERRR